MINKPLLQAEALRFRFQDDILAVDGITLQLAAGDRLALVGKNGSGKSTLAKLLAGLLKPDSGQVLLNGDPTENIPPGRLAQSIGFVFQNPDHQIFSSSVREEIAFGPRNLGLTGPELDKRIEDILHRFELVDFADHPPANLSYGLRRVVSVAAVAAMRTPILILDEPSLGLDWSRAKKLLEQIMALEPQALLLISHDLDLLAQFAEETAVVDRGRLLIRSNTHAALQDEPTLTEVGFEPPPLSRLVKELSYIGIPKELVDARSLSQHVKRLAEGQQE